MNTETLLIPKTLGLKKTLDLYKEISNLPLDSKIVFDFKNMGYVSPFSFLLISSAVSNLVEAIKNRQQGGAVFCEGFERHSYHAHMGFFKSFGLDFGNSPGEAHGSGRYIPVTLQSVVDILRESVGCGVPVGEVVEEYAQPLAKVLAQSDKSDLFETFTYSFREIIRNAAEHSESRIVEYCAQYWPSQDRAEIAILDKGIGIVTTLKKNPHLYIESEQHGLNLSLLPGVSGRSYKGARIKDQGGWENSGWGLYMTRRICGHDGDFFIGSHNASVYFKGDRKTYIPFKYPGTVVRMAFKPSSIGKISEALKNYNEEGKLIASKIRGTVVNSSSASKMLSSEMKSN